MRKLAIIAPIELEEIKSKVEELDKKFSIKHFDIVPLHLTLYVWESLNVIEQITKILTDLLEKYKPFFIFTDNLVFTEYSTLQLNIVNSIKLNSLHKDIVKKMSKFRDKKADSKTKQFYNTFNIKEKILVNQYGRPNVLENFKSHLTIEKIPKESSDGIKVFLSDFNTKYKICIDKVELIEMIDEDYKVLIVLYL